MIVVVPRVSSLVCPGLAFTLEGPSVAGCNVGERVGISVRGLDVGPAVGVYVVMVGAGVG
eukprot:1395376-Amorphochlora_amoeboformis.AAC.1